MDAAQATTEFLLAQCARYPLLQPQDLLKALHQSVFGCGHFISDGAGCLARLQSELSAPLPPLTAPAIEPLDGGFRRVHLQYLTDSGLAPETLCRLFAASAKAEAAPETVLAEKLDCLLHLAAAGELPCSQQDVAQAVSAWKEAGYPACRHSEAFCKAYAPAYRVLAEDHARPLPLLAAIERLLAEKRRVIVALEGGSASGKSTLADLLASLYDCSIFHMDDFFLRPEQRTKARLTEPGGNVDRERFQAEVLAPLAAGETVRYRRYDCKTQTVQPPVEIPPKALNIVEGAYSMHPELAPAYDLSAFMPISRQLQHIRLGQRNTPEMQAMFFTLWIPLELRYFEVTDAANRCTLQLEEPRI